MSDRPALTLDTLPAFLAKARSRFLEAITTIAPEWVHWSPDSGSWSALQIVEHVAIGEEWYNEIIEGLVAKGRQAGWLAAADAPRRIDCVPEIQRLYGDRTRFPAADFAQPRGGWDLPELLLRLERSRNRLLDWLPVLAELDTDRLVYEHPTLHFRFTAVQWVHMSGLHELQHARQLRTRLDQISRFAS